MNKHIQKQEIVLEEQNKYTIFTRGQNTVLTHEDHITTNNILTGSKQNNIDLELI